MSSMKNIRNMVIRAIPSAQSYSVIGPVKHGELRASEAGANSYSMLTSDKSSRADPGERGTIGYLTCRLRLQGLTLLTCIKAVAMITPEPKYFVMKKAKGGTRMRLVRAAIIGNKAPAGY